jgi:hypothetical protein
MNWTPIISIPEKYKFIYPLKKYICSFGLGHGG